MITVKDIMARDKDKLPEAAKALDSSELPLLIELPWSETTTSGTGLFSSFCIARSFPGMSAPSGRASRQS